MINNYQLTPLEQWIDQLYNNIGISSSHQLNILELSEKLNIWVYYMDMGSKAIENNGLYSICVDRRLSHQEQWEDFLHELCHALRHSGNQTYMPEHFTNWQEQDAANFQLYAAVPYSMLSKLEFPKLQSELIEFLHLEFGVTYPLARRRLEQIERRVLHGTLQKETVLFLESKKKKYEWSDQTKAIMDQLHKQLKEKGVI